MSLPCLRLVNVSRHYGRLKALAQVSVECRGGEIVGLVGPNGSGKSTLIAVMATLARPSAGRIESGWRGTPGDAPELRAELGVLGHDLCLYPELTARENLRFFGRLYGVTDLEARVEAALAAADLDRRADEPVGRFSRGMRQRLAFERSVLHEPGVVLLDEPFTGLDQASAARLVHRLQGLRRAGRAVVLATHDLELVEGLLDRAVILCAGRATVVEAPGTALGARYAAVVGGDAAGHALGRAGGGAAAPAAPVPAVPAGGAAGPVVEAPAEEATGSRPARRVVPGTARVVWHILQKDLIIETRSREVIATTLFFAVACVLIFSFGFVDDGRAVAGAAGGILWITVAFSGTLALGRIFERERANATLQGLLLAPVPRAAVYLGKLAGLLGLMAAVQLVVVPLVLLFFQVERIAEPALLVGLLAAGTLGFAAIGALFAAMLTRASSREVLLPIVLYPMTVPVLIAGVRGTLALIDPAASEAMAPTWLAMLVFFDTVFVTLALWTFEPVMTD